jgi:tetratricopeptide (TPR) repeat protein
VTVTPRPAPFTERLSYHFLDPTDTQTEVVLRWAELEVPFSVAVNTPEVVLAGMERELRGLPRFFWNGWNEIALYALQQRTRLDDALGWVDQSIALNRNATNLATRILLLEATGRADEADALEAEMLTTATEAQVNTYGYTLLGLGRTADAIAVFRRNVADYPDSWNVHDSLGEALALAGETAEAITHYEHARALAPALQHPRIDGILAGLRAAAN